MPKTIKNSSTAGYKRDSPDKDRPYNVIPSGNITMEGVDETIIGIDDLGNEKVMHPGEKEINFPGSMVLEFKKDTKNKKQIYNRIFKKQII